VRSSERTAGVGEIILLSLNSILETFRFSPRRSDFGLHLFCVVG
jgi:hypothetical protein